MIRLSPQQQSVVDRPLGRLCVTACAGSGKTRTVVHRVARLCELLKDNRGRIALLSFSNVAVDTFKRDYRSIADGSLPSRKERLVDIATFDSFFTTNVLKPHGHHTMGCKSAPFLVHGTEPFLAGFTFNLGKFPQGVNVISATFENGGWTFYSTFKNSKTQIDTNVAVALTAKLGRLGAYTHDFGRYWSYRVLKEQDHVLRALVRRYPQIVIDEAQDIGPSHQAILDVLQAAGCTISLVGDVNQGIFEFNGADGQFLAGYHGQVGVDVQELTTNFRSVPDILKVANSLTGRNDDPDREAATTLNGAFFTTFRSGERDDLLKTFKSMLVSAELSEQDAAIVCRGNEWVNEWRGTGPDQGRGSTKFFAQAAILRDAVGNFDAAFNMVIRGILGLLDKPPAELASQLRRPGTDEAARVLRRLLWKFLRDDATGLPSASLPASTAWHPLLVTRTKDVLAKITEVSGLAAARSIGNRLSKAELRASPLIAPNAESRMAALPIRVETVHGVKGESIDAVMYVASKEHVKELISGPATEVGRIGYVALTRARNLFLLAIPEKNLRDLSTPLEAHGFRRYPNSKSTTASSMNSSPDEAEIEPESRTGVTGNFDITRDQGRAVKAPRPAISIERSTEDSDVVEGLASPAASSLRTGRRSNLSAAPTEQAISRKVAEVPTHPRDEDWYANFAELSKQEVENVDYSISVIDRGTPIAIVAPHGGFIEPGTSELTVEIAGSDYSRYIFASLKSGRKHNELHITSSRFDEKRCLGLLSRTAVVVGIHGRADDGDGKTIFLGGLDTTLKGRMETELTSAGFKTLTDGHRFPGLEPTNICNRGTSTAGVQLEIPRSLRDRLVNDRMLRSEFAWCVRSALALHLKV